MGGTRTTIVLAMHGAPPMDFPKQDLGEFFGLHMQLEHAPVEPDQASPHRKRYAALEKTMLEWPRDETNDPFYAASHRLAEALRQSTGLDVMVGFNEFCAPSIAQALDQAVDQGADRVLVVTPMMTPGGEHAEIDIPAAIDAARRRHRRIDFRYAWPFDTDDVAAFLAQQVLRHI
jgi:sirohydrochlorin cobaltochelatase